MLSMGRMLGCQAGGSSDSTCLSRYGVSIDASRSDYSGGQKPEAGAGGDERKKEQMKNIMRRLKGIILAAARWTRPPSSTRPLGTSSCSRWRSRSSVCVAQAAKCATSRPDVDSDLAQRLTGTRMESRWRGRRAEAPERRPQATTQFSMPSFSLSSDVLLLSCRPPGTAPFPRHSSCRPSRQLSPYRAKGRERREGRERGEESVSH